MDAYNADIDYKNLLTRYLKYLYKNWIAKAEIAARYPHMVNHTPMFEFAKYESASPWGGTIVELCVKGDLYKCSAVCKPNENETYYDMLKNALSSGIAIMTSEDIWDSSHNYIPCNWSASEMIAELDKRGIERGVVVKDYIDFIDSRTLQEYYRTTPLPPAMMCILIAQSHCRPLADKLAALREILAATPPGDFADGEYQLACNDLDFAAALDRHIRLKEERLADFLAPAPDVVYVPHDPRGGYDIAVFATFAECLDFLSPIEQPEVEYISIERCRIGNPSASLSGCLSFGKTLFDVETPEDNRIDSGYEEWRWDFAKSFVRVPHPFRPGDIVQWGDERFSVVVHPELPPVPKRWSSGIDFCDQHFSTLVFRPDRTHPCGGVFSIDDVMPAGSTSALERVDPEELPEEYGVLLSVAEVVAGRTCICQLLEAYSQGALDSLLKFTREQRAKRNDERGMKNEQQ